MILFLPPPIGVAIKFTCIENGDTGKNLIEQKKRLNLYGTASYLSNECFLQLRNTSSGCLLRWHVHTNR